MTDHATETHAILAPGIEAHALSKIFPDKKRGAVAAVDDVSLSCRPGEIFGLLGPNGAGKTTLLRMLATILQPTGGTATVAGFDVARQAQDVRRNIGYVSNSTALYERLTPREMVAYFGALYGLPPDEVGSGGSSVLFTELDMHEFADRRCDKLSTGPEAARLHRPDHPARAARAVLRRADQRPGRAGRPHHHPLHPPLPGRGPDGRLLHPHHERGGGAVRPHRRDLQGRASAVGTLDELRARTGEQLFERVFLRLIGEDPDE